MKKLVAVLLTLSGMALADTISTPVANTVVPMLPNATYATDTSLGNTPFFNNVTSDLGGLGNAGYFLTNTGAFASTLNPVTPPTGYLGQVSNNSAAALAFDLVRQATSINVTVLYQDAPQTNANQGSILSGTTVGIYDASNPANKFQIFGPGGITTGATANNFSTAGISGTGTYGFYATVCQPGFGLGNCYTFYSDTSLNPSVSNEFSSFVLEGPGNVHQHFALFTLASGGFYLAFENSVSSTSFDGVGGPEHYGVFDSFILGINTGAGSVPEPATLSMMGLGLLSLGLMGRRLRKR
jgi:hypothetical protein